jgi:hypothetical protein
MINKRKCTATSLKEISKSKQVDQHTTAIFVIITMRVRSAPSAPNGGYTGYEYYDTPES